MHEVVVGDDVRVFIAHDLSPRALYLRLKGSVHTQSWSQDLTLIVISDANEQVEDSPCLQCQTQPNSSS